MTQNDECLRVENLVVSYGNELVLNEVSFAVQKGEIFIVMGGSGSGKSTLLRHMTGLETPADGNVNIGDIDIIRAEEGDFTHILKKIGVLFQSNALIGSMTIGENIALPIREHLEIDARLIPTIVRMKLAMVGLECYEQHLPSEISGGMEKRAGLARAMALNPEILFLDEPSAGLDPVTASEIDDLILHINKTLGTTMVIVTHDLDSISAIGHRAILLDKNGKNIIARGDPRKLQENHENQKVRDFFKRKDISASSST